MGLGDVRIAPCCACFVFLCLIIFTCIAVPNSYATLQRGEYAVVLNWATQELERRVLTQSGLYAVGLGNTLVKFPATYQTMYFVADKRGIGCSEDTIRGGCEQMIEPPLSVRSKDGLLILLSMSFQWRHRPDDLDELYALAGNSAYRYLYARLSRSAVIVGASKFSAADYFTDRNTISDEITRELIAHFQRPKDGIEVDIVSVQLREVDLPDPFEWEIANTQANMQDLYLAYAERDSEIVTMQQNLVVMDQTVQQMLQDASGSAAATRISNEAFVSNFQNAQLRLANAHAEILQYFANDTMPFQCLFEVIELRGLDEHDEDKMYVNIV